MAKLRHAMICEPEPLAPEHLHQLTWEAATERCIEASIITRRDARRNERLGLTETDEKATKFLKSLLSGTRGDVVRGVFVGREVGEQLQYSMAKASGKEIEKELLNRDIYVT